MPEVQIKRVVGWGGKHRFVDVPFRIHGGDPSWVPPLRVTVYDRLSTRHPAAEHQEVSLWVAYRNRRPVGRIAACIDSTFNAYQGVKWAWVGFFSSLDDPGVACALFDTARQWSAEHGADTCVGPADFTTNDELGLLVEGFDDPPAIMTLQNPRYYEKLWTAYGWEQAMDLWGWELTREGTALSDRQRRRLDRLAERSGVRARGLRMDDYDNEVGRFFDIYNAAWQHNWGFAPMSEAEVRHLAGQLRQIIRPEWAFGLETIDGEAVAVCLAIPDLNSAMRHVRSGRLFPTGWYRLLSEKKKVSRARVWALGIRPDYQHLALGPLLYREIADRLRADPHFERAEASWTLATNRRINNQMEAMGGRRNKVWRLYQCPAGDPAAPASSGRGDPNPTPAVTS